MPLKFNPQFDMEFFLLNEDGTEEPTPIPFLENVSLKHFQGNYPTHTDVALSMSMTSGQNTADITFKSPYFYEYLVLNYQAVIEEFRNKLLRVYIWHWYSNSLAQTFPEYGPMFIGEIVLRDGLSTSGTDITIRAHSHYRISAIKYKKTFEAGQTYREIVDEIFLTLETEYGYEPAVVQDLDDELGLKLLPRAWSINTNVGEVLNRICGTMDFNWFMHNNTPCLVKRDEFFDPGIAPIELVKVETPEISNLSGKLGINAYTFGGIQCQSRPDNEFVVGRKVRVTDAPQITGGGFLDARIDAINARLTNYGPCSMQMSLTNISGDRCILPDLREKTTARELV